MSICSVEADGQQQRQRVVAGSLRKFEVVAMIDVGMAIAAIRVERQTGRQFVAFGVFIRSSASMARSAFAPS
jgi:hypothetical protein